MIRAYIYYILNLKTNKRYIGSTKNAIKRKQYHWNDLNKNNHPNEHLQNSWNKYGKESFKFKIIEECNIENIEKREEFYCIKYKTFDNKYGYNIAPISKNPIYEYDDKNFHKFCQISYIRNNPEAKVLSKSEILEIYLLKDSDKYTKKEITEKFGVSKNTIVNIHRGKSWNHITGAIPKKTNPKKILSKEEYDIVVNLLLKGVLTQKEIADKLKIGTATVTKISKETKEKLGLTKNFRFFSKNGRKNVYGEKNEYFDEM